MQRKRIPRRFRFPYTAEQVYTMLYASCRAEVTARMRTFNATAEYKQHIWDIARWLVSNDSKFGLFLSGNKGNGKTTMVYALKALYAYVHSDSTYTPESKMHELPYTGFRIVTAKELSLIHI